MEEAPPFTSRGAIQPKWKWPAQPNLTHTKIARELEQLQGEELSVLSDVNFPDSPDSVRDISDIDSITSEAEVGEQEEEQSSEQEGVALPRIPLAHRMHDATVMAFVWSDGENFVPDIHVLITGFLVWQRIFL